ncbi:MAG TPA: ABC transporter ATP-binding protein [Myxococcales bacterium]|nr:ABC transporter ATP-binding protein [Myxococcales bacterium]
MSILRAESLSKRFGGLKAVDAVDLELEEGEILGVIGPNGAGKTTLFSMIAGSIPPTSGRVVLEGEVISGASARRAVRAGVVRTHQIVRPFHSLTVFENVMVGAIYGKARPRGAHERTLEVLGFCGLRDRASQLPGGLTLAGRKRLELARAIATEPRVLLLDEVIAGVNPAEALQMADLIRSVREKRGLSIILIEHVMPAVMRLSDRVIVLDAGKKIAEGKPQQVVTNPRVVAAYLGESASSAAAAQAGARSAATPASGTGVATRPTPPSNPTPTATGPAGTKKVPPRGDA